MAEEWHVSEARILLGITTFCIGFVITPIIFTPFSEINRRYPVLLGARVVFVSSQICCAITRSYFRILF
jgi:predicted MFS family arabinose efflux permease